MTTPAMELAAQEGVIAEGGGTPTRRPAPGPAPTSARMRAQRPITTEAGRTAAAMEGTDQEMPAAALEMATAEAGMSA